MGTSRFGLGVMAAAAAGAVFVAGLAVGNALDGGAAPGRPVAAGPGGVALANGDLTRAASCDALLDWYVERGLDLVGPYGWGGGPIMYAAEDGAMESGESSAKAPAPTTASGVDEQSSSETGTNTQEAGVDEADSVKTNGEILARVNGNDVLIYDVTGSEPVLISTTTLDGIAEAQLLLAGDRLVAIGFDTTDDGSSSKVGPDIYFAGNGRTRMAVLDIADPAAPTVVEDYGYDGTLVTARQHGTVVRLTLSKGLPQLDFTQPGGLSPEGDKSEREALSRNRELVEATTLEDWLPGLTSYGDSGAGDRQDLLDCADVAIPTDEQGLGTLAVVGFDTATPETWDASAVATDSQVAYESGDRLVLASSNWQMWGGGWPVPECFRCVVGDAIRGPLGLQSSRDDKEGLTTLYSFALDGTRAAYVASGDVEGTIRDRWAMDEAGGSLRVAVGQSSQTGNFNSVITLREEGSALVEAGRVDKLGIDEEIKSVRWFDDLAIVVTFRQTDPLYAIDLSDPAAPRLLGELKIPGFSEYLHPIDGQRLLGLGQDADVKTGATKGAQAALFDVTDLASPRRLATVAYDKDSYALAGQDPRQFTWLSGKQIGLAVIGDGWSGTTGWVSVLTVADGTLRNRMVEVEYGTDVYKVRLTPLPDGRVVLVTGDEVSFFDV